MASARRIAALDGVRGVAITVGFIYHLPASPLASGAMAVIDMFFVLSGFLIGGIVLRQAERGKVHLGQFWAGRIRRLFPAAGLMLIIWGLASWWLASKNEWDLWSDQIAWAAWYAENLHLISIDNNYFAEGRDSPFVHMWSLAVEEQFYLLFPLLVLFAMGLYRVLPRFSIRQWVGGIALVLGIASYVYGQISFDPSHPAVAYYDPRAHAHGLFAGVLLACVYGPIARWLDAHRRLNPIVQTVGLVGLIVILTATVGADTSEGYHRFGAGLTVLGTLVLVVAAQQAGITSRILGWKPLAFTGEISYGIYIWGGGITVLLGRALLEANTLPVWGIWLVCGGVTFAFATASWRFVEMPIRQWDASIRRPGLTIALGVSAMAIIGVAFALLPARPVALGSTTVTGDSRPACEQQDGEGITQAGCVLYTPQPNATILLVGNSAMYSLEPGFAELAQKNNWQLLAVIAEGCPIGETLGSAEEQQRYEDLKCAMLPETVNDVLDTERVDMIVALGMLGAGAPTDPVAQEEATKRYRDMFNSWTDHATLVLLEDYRTLDPPGTTALRSDPADDVASQDFLRRMTLLDSSRAILREAVAGNGNATVIELDPIVCPTGWPCPEVIDGVRLRRDQMHLTAEGAAWVVPQLEQKLLDVLDAVRR